MGCEWPLEEFGPLEDGVIALAHGIRPSDLTAKSLRSDGPEGELALHLRAVPVLRFLLLIPALRKSPGNWGVLCPPARR